MSLSRISLAALLPIALAGCPSSGAKPTVNTPSPKAPTTTVETELPPHIAAEIDRLSIGLLVDDFEVQQQSAVELGQLGADAAGALPDLTYCLEVEGDPHAACADAIVAITGGDSTLLVGALEIPLMRKQIVVAALADHAREPRPLLQNLFLESCRRAESSDIVDISRHWLGTASASLDALEGRTTDDDTEPRALGTVCTADQVQMIASR